MQKYVKKPIVIEAHRWTYSYQTFEYLKDMGCPCILAKINGKEELLIKTLEGDMLARYADYIVKGIKGEWYPVKPDIFEATYDEVAE
jgi:hypothetical protein